VIEHLQTHFRELYEPSANLTIDEAMCPFRGRGHGKVYMWKKPNKYSP
jgi:hypothetical protein